MRNADSFSLKLQSWFGFLMPSLLSHSSGRGWGRPIFSGFCLISFYKFLPWISISATYLLFASCPVPLFLYHEVLTCSRRRPPGDTSPHLEGQSQPPFSLRKVKGLLALLLFQRYSACLLQWDLMYQSCPMGKNFSLYWILVSDGIQRIKSVWRRRDTNNNSFE